MQQLSSSGSQTSARSSTGCFFPALSRTTGSSDTLIFAAGHINTQPGSVLALAACYVHQLTNSYSVLLSFVYPLAQYLCAW